MTRDHTPKNLPYGIHTEVTVTTDSIVIQLFTERTGETGVRAEDQIEIDLTDSISTGTVETLSLSSETGENLSEMVEIVEEQVSREMYWIPDVGEKVIDKNPPEWSENNMLEVVRISDKTADEYVVEERFANPDETVARANPSHPEDVPVVEAKYIDGNDDTYAFPVTRVGDPNY